MFQAAAFQEVIEFPLDIRRQYRALFRQMGGERRVILFNDLIEKSLLGPMALVTVSTQSHAGIPCHSGVGHRSHPCEFVLRFRLAGAPVVVKTECLDDDFTALRKELNIPGDGLLPKTNISKETGYRDQYSSKMREIVADIYSTDIALFNYSF